jgi:hypothetical protein
MVFLDDGTEPSVPAFADRLALRLSYLKSSILGYVAKVLETLNGASWKKSSMFNLYLATKPDS